jgi:hypothetical protein
LLELTGQIQRDAGRVTTAMEWGEGTPWRPLDLREDARGGGVSLDPWRERLRRT